MFRRPILINRPVKSPKASIYRPAMLQPPCEDADDAPSAGLKRTVRLAEKLRQCAPHTR